MGEVKTGDKEMDVKIKSLEIKQVDNGYIVYDSQHGTQCVAESFASLVALLEAKFDEELTPRKKEGSFMRMDCKK